MLGCLLLTLSYLGPTLVIHLQRLYCSGTETLTVPVQPVVVPTVPNFTRA